ncbi:histidine phosphatase family protein [Cytobacillus purgationiresistens]|uniref:Broad specificity phosphatase PhoE n=1 Tax=Cytobacillus purgationiresistens TaxID=863449 RepID=A0ABU0AJC0_9BACI|nr:histidine phosphatase family protein [Cytobacillus purgationiresistens]MDQ0271362.1 broad specificity phosphatase PhoE [Cytobacillus purgationiresistens]
MTTVGLVRHGVTEWNKLMKAQGLSDIPLDETGKDQVHALGRRLAAEEEWDIIVSSDLKRAAETAQIIAEATGHPNVICDERIREIDCGMIEGTTEDDRQGKWGADWRSLDLGMEKREAVAKRGITFLNEIIEKYEGKRVLVVSHGAFIGITLQYLLPERFQRTLIENTAITILKHIDNVWDCTLYNCIKHIAADKLSVKELN